MLEQHSADAQNFSRMAYRKGSSACSWAFAGLGIHGGCVFSFPRAI